MFNQPEIAQENPSPGLFPPCPFGICSAPPWGPKGQQYGHTSKRQILNINLFKLNEISDVIHFGLFQAAIMSCFNFCVCSYPAQELYQSPLTHQICNR